MAEQDLGTESKSFFYRRRKRELTAILIGVLAYVSYVLFLKGSSSPVVDTVNGKLIGSVTKSRIGREYYEYVGIRYASPKTERFEPPIPPENWEGIRSATSFGAQCYQIDVITSFMLGSEDCLFLNVFVPKHAKDSGKVLPVLFWIYGGGFQSGTSDIYRPTYFMDEDVVMVSVNYRLGALGFLNSGDHLIRGNQGMKDLVLALKWVKHNIRNFSGDPNSVTLFGESAGGGAVHYLMVSPLAKGLFHKGISQSGSVLNTWLYSRYPKEQAKSLAERVNCPTATSDEMVKCLKHVDARDIVRTHIEMTVPPRPRLGKYAPSIEAIQDETTFLPESPLEMLKKGKFAHIPWMTGVDREEGLPFANEIMENATVIDWANQDLRHFLTRILFLNNSPDRPEDAPQRLWDYYFGTTKKLDPTESMEGLSEIHASRFFFVSLHRSAQYHMKHAPVYLYYYNYPTEFGFLKLMRSLRGTYLPLVETVYELAKHWVYKIFGLEIQRGGISHGEEMLLQFSFPFIPGAPVGSSDYEISRDLIKSWVGFAYNPNTLKFQGHKWNPQSASNKSLKYMKIEPNSPGFIDEPFTDQVRLWDELNIE
ncbi:unnamed protein product [Orchesella dallaii]|uniref:Carboxylesterase type B domain-containing protein n=1 Tax=Orchesella dallaii TaxID=48710 RepID=A0ABP1Q619_9HEXA